jgi:hypothetical protein
MMIAVLASIAVIVSAPAAAAIAAEACDFTGWQSECTVSNSGEQVDVGASITDPGPPSDGGGSDEGAMPAPTPFDPTFGCSRQDCAGYSVLMPPDLTAEDLASFRPAAPSLTGEPVGFGLVDAPTTVVAAASEQVMTGTILGWDVTVRFVPAGYVFTYGDGTSSRVETGGASWSTLRQAQFTPTATSHVYRERGTYPVSVTVQYAASVDFGSGTWRPVTGFVTATSGGYDVQVVEARTALVQRTCAENPSGPGC